MTPTTARSTAGSSTDLHRRRLCGALCLAALLPVRAQTAFDASHAEWNVLLRKHVVLIAGGKASQLRYAGMQQDRAALKRYLSSLSAVGRAEFDGWRKPQQMAFLINAYNAFTVELILGSYPGLQSIKDLGGFISSPWKKSFFSLLGAPATLDGVEHQTLRKRGVYDDPRVHFAVNCASIGCPMLREEAYVAERLEAQLQQQLERFLSDRSRNRYDTKAGRLEVSKIFDWYGEDFRLGHQGIASLPALFGQHAALLADAPEDQARLRGQQVKVAYLEYDWQLNDASR